MCKDYRITKYDNEFGDIEEKKKEYEIQLKKEHPRKRNFYDLISPNQDEKKRFAKIYNYRCCYCGIPIDYSSITGFEIDHIVPETSFSKPSDAGNIYNLALACHNCNHSKSNLQIDLSILHPDIGIGEVYYRDDLFYIKTSPKYLGNTCVMDFYEKLNFGGDLKRLDYVLMNLSGIKQAYKQKFKKNSSAIDDAIQILLIKRNLCLPKQ